MNETITVELSSIRSRSSLVEVRKMYCSSCGVAVAQGLPYCNHCGAKLNQSDSVNTSSEPRPEYLCSRFGIFVFGLYYYGSHGSDETVLTYLSSGFGFTLPFV